VGTAYLATLGFRCPNAEGNFFADDTSFLSSLEGLNLHEKIYRASS
jgi:hypothetical protein